MLFFEINEKTFRGEASEQFECSHCQHKSSRLISSVRFLSFSLFSLLPLRTKYYSECTSCKRRTEHKRAVRGLFPNVNVGDKFAGFFGSIVLCSFGLLAYSYSNFLDEHGEKVRLTPKVGDILFVHQKDAPMHTEYGIQLPYRMAKVVKLEPELNAIAISYGIYTYDSNTSINRDFIGRQHLFDSYFKRKVEMLPLSQLTDTNMVFDTKRSLREANKELVKPLFDLNKGVLQQIQQTNELTRLFNLFS